MNQLIVIIIITDMSTWTVSLSNTLLHNLEYNNDNNVDNLGRLLDQAEYEQNLIRSKRFSSSISCVDQPRERHLCPLWKKAGACRFRSWMRKYCARTCDICTPPAPPIPVLPPCARTKYGCCWDNRTVARGPVEDIVHSQCAPCMDRQSLKFCVGWSDKCNSTIIGQGDVMRERCAGKIYF